VWGGGEVTKGGGVVLRGAVAQKVEARPPLVEHIGVGE
jgi:hypothetical protein